MAGAVVIGAGFGGLAAALRLQAAGHQVTLLEKEPAPGGRAHQIRDGGYIFDGGPSIITAPHLLRSLFAAAGRRLDDEVELLALEPYYRLIFADHSHLDYSGNAEVMAEQIARFNPADPAGYRRFMRTTGRIYHRAFDDLAGQPFDSLGDFLRVVPELARLRADRSVYSLVSEYIRDRRLRMAFSFQPLFLGGNPFRASSIFSIIPYLERTGGVHFARGGMYALVRALVRVFEQLGGQLVCDAPVEQLEVRAGRVRAVCTADGRRWPVDLVVSNADVPWLYRNLIAPEHRRHNTDVRIDRYKLAMSCYVLYLGLDRQYERLLHHTVIMSDRYREVIADIFDRRVLPRELSVYAHAPSKTDPSLAPPGCESLYVLAPVPHLTADVDWERESGPFRDRIIRLLEHDVGLSGLEASIRVEHRFNPLDFQQRFNAYRGSAFSIEPRLFQSAYFRPHNRSEDVRGLYLTGAGTHPGAGLPGVLLSAEIVSRLVAEDFGPPSSSDAFSIRRSAGAPPGSVPRPGA